MIKMVDFTPFYERKIMKNREFIYNNVECSKKLKR